jgi:AcrR family transcriptional regulator
MTEKRQARPAGQGTKTRRQRRAPEVVRAAAVHAARQLLLRAGPQAITFTAIAKELGMTHGNITHHFGSVSALHAALVSEMAHDLATSVDAAVHRLRDDGAPPITVVDPLFDAFAKGGAGRLIAWLALSGNLEALEPLFSTVAQAVEALARSEPEPKPGEQRRLAVRQNALVLLAAALGNALIGERLHAAVGLKANALRTVSAADLVLRANAAPEGAPTH